MRGFTKKIVAVFLSAFMVFGVITQNGFSFADQLENEYQYSEIEPIENTSGSTTESTSEIEVNDTTSNSLELFSSIDTFNSTELQSSSTGKFLAPIEPPVEGSIPISDRAGLDAIRNNLSGNYHLVTDIDLAGEEWVPIGDMVRSFTGIFNGQGHIIKNLTITKEIVNDWNHSKCYGLFGVASIVINVGLENVNISVELSQLADGVYPNANANIGGIAGVAGSITNCYTTGKISLNGSIGIHFSGIWYCVGGICGALPHASKSYNLADIDVNLTSAMTIAVGGISGAGDTNGSGFSECYNAGNISSIIDVTADNPGANVYVCGIVASGMSFHGINNCYNTGNIEATAYALDTDDFTYEGQFYPDRKGFVATAFAFANGISQGGKIDNCYNSGSINSNASSNGRIWSEETKPDWAISAGISNNLHTYGDTISNSASMTNTVTSSHESYVIGKPEGKIESCYAANDVNTDAIADTITLYPRNSFAHKEFWEGLLGFDFDTVWEMPDGGSPVFIGQSGVIPPIPPSPILNGDIEAKVITAYSDIKDGDISYEVWFGGDFFANDGNYYSSNYNHSLATVAMALSAAAYDYSDIEQALGSLGFADVKPHNYDQNDKNTVGFTFGSKTLNFGVGDERLVAVVVRGTEGSEWYGNFDMGTDATHLGFKLAENDVWNALTDYIAKTIYESENQGFEIPTHKFLITGHSRGAAVANLLAADLTKNLTEFQDTIKAKLMEYNSSMSEDAIDTALETTFTPQNIFAYTFATPNVTTMSEAKGNGYSNIYNIVNAEDFVPYMPLTVSGWDYWKYGTTYVFPSGGTDGGIPTFWTPQIQNMRTKFKSLTGKDFDSYYFRGFYAVQNFVRDMKEIIPNASDYYKDDLFDFNIGSAYAYFTILAKILITSNPIIVGGLVSELYNGFPEYDPITDFLVGNGNSIVINNMTHSHTPETYIAWLQATSESSLLDKYSLVHGLYARIACPVDIEVYNDSGTLVGKTVDNVPDDSLDGEIGVYVTGDVKSVYMPKTGDYTIRFTATDSGVMSYTLEEYNILTGEPDTEKMFSNVVLSDGKNFTSSVNGESGVADTQLFVTDGNTNISEVMEDGTEVPQTATTSYSISATAGIGGSVTGRGTYASGASVTLTAVPNSQYYFVGWYENNAKVPNAGAVYTFSATSDRVIEARFAYNTSSGNNNSGSGGSSNGDGGGGTSTYTNASVSPAKADFDKKGSKDLAVTFSRGSYALLSITNGSFSLKKDTDYTANGNNYVIKASYLAALAAGEQVLTFNMSGGIDPKLTIAIKDTNVATTPTPSTAVEPMPSPEPTPSPILPQMQNPFEDVAESGWYYNDVLYAYENNLMSGISTSPMLFSPETPLTRGMIVTILWRLDGNPSMAESQIPFNDVAPEIWYAEPIKWAAANGIVSGYGDGSFKPDDGITRQDLAVILLRYMNYREINLPVTQQYVFFADEEQIADYAKNAIQTFYKLGIISGVGNNTIAPNDNATRAETAAMLHRLMENVMNT